MNNTPQNNNNFIEKMMSVKTCPATEKINFICNTIPTENYTPNEFNGSDLIIFFVHNSPKNNSNENNNKNNENSFNSSKDKPNNNVNPQEFVYDEELQKCVNFEEEMFENDNENYYYKTNNQISEFDKKFAFGDFENFLMKQKFKPKIGFCKTMNITGTSKVKNFAVIGMGYENSDCSYKGKIIANEAVKCITKNKSPTVTFIFPNEMNSFKFLQKFMEEFYTVCTPENYFFSNPDENDPFKDIQTIYFTTPIKYHPVFNNMNTKSKQMAQATCMVKQLTSAPSNYCNPLNFVKIANSVASKTNMEFNMYNKDFMEKESMGGMVAVSKGSMFEPKFVHMTYKPNDSVPKEVVAFVGCGVMYDSGGYNMKNTNMEKMNYEMSGAAATLAAAYLIGTAKPQYTQCEFYMYVGENMVSSTSFKPGDVFTSYNGKTVEANSMDSSACMAMCDAVAFANKNSKPNCIFEMSSTTHTFAKAMGTEYTPMFYSNKTIMKNFVKSSMCVGEKVFPIPYYTMKHPTKCKFADFNSAPNSKFGHAITNANFIKQFAEKTPFVHIEMNGPSYNPDTNMPTGYGATSCAEYVFDASKHYSKQSPSMEEMKEKEFGANKENTAKTMFFF